MTHPPALTLDGLTVRYGAHAALEHVSLEVRRGEIVGLLGPNGSGKSTTLACAAGVLTPLAGSVTLAGVRQGENPTAFARLVGLVPQEPALYDELSAKANLQFFGRLYGFGGRELAGRVARGLEMARLSARHADRVGTFSGGMRQRLNLAVALLHDPPLLLLDEPTAALDPASRDALFSTLFDLREAGHAVLLTTHHLDEAEFGCDRLAVLERGKLVASGTPHELIRSRPGGRAVLYAHTREVLPKFFQKSLRKRVGVGVELEITGRRLRLGAADEQALGRALAVVLADGVSLERFRTPPGRLDHLLRGAPAPVAEEAPCDAT